MTESSENSAGAESTAEIPSGMRALGELLAADEPSEETEETAGAEKAKPDGSQEKAKPTKFNDLAGTLGMELDALYKLEIASSEDGEPVTIEALKDLHANTSDFELSKLEFEEQRTQKEQELMRAQAELNEILSVLPKGSVKPEVLERIRAKNEAALKIEREKTLDVIPAWKDSEQRKSDIAGMAEHLQAYGFPVNYLTTVANHMQLKYIRDNWQREQRMRKALEKVRAGKPEKKVPSKPQKKAPVKNAAAHVKPKPGRSKLETVFSNLD